MGNKVEAETRFKYGDIVKHSLPEHLGQSPYPFIVVGISIHYTLVGYDIEYALRGADEKGQVADTRLVEFYEEELEPFIE